MSCNHWRSAFASSGLTEQAHPEATLLQQRFDVAPSSRSVRHGEPDGPAGAVQRNGEEEGEADHDRDVPLGD